MESRVRLSFVLGLIICLSGPAVAQPPPGPPPSPPAFPSPTTSPEIGMVTGTFRVVAISRSGQEKSDALRAAKVMAQRDLLEIVQGLQLWGETTVQKASLDNDVIRTKVEGFLQGAQECGSDYNPTTGTGTICLELPARGPGGLTGTLLGTKEVRERLDRIVPPAPSFVPATPPPPPAPSDGLIVDTTGHTFKPGLVNRILTLKGEVLYDPTKIAPSILVERGSGDYTNDMGKARAILDLRGAKSPFVVTAAAVSRLTDVQVSEADANAIFAANQRTNFLEGAKVVFVLR